MSKTMKIIAMRKNRTGNRSGVSFAGMIPHSYGARLRSFDARGARRPDVRNEPAAKTAARPAMRTIGRY